MTTFVTQTPAWVAACGVCGWTTPAATYTQAGNAARDHADTYEDAATTVTPAPEPHLERDDDLGVTVELDDMPGIPALAHNARVVADLLFVDPPTAYEVVVRAHRVSVRAAERDCLCVWAARRLQRTGPHSWAGHVEGVELHAVCEVPA